jgi:Outer membrane protein beta-barrel domain
MKAVLGMLCVAMLVVAANADAKKMVAGVKGGVNMADFGGDDAPDNSSMRTGISVGAFYGFGINDQFGVRGEVNYVQKGDEGDVQTEDGDIHTGTYKFDYVEIPLLFVAGFPAGDKFAFSIFGGPTFAFNTTAEVEIPAHNVTEDLSEITKGFEFGAAIGGGIEYMLSSFSIIADLRYSLGASTIIDDGSGDSIDVKNNGIGIMAGVQFPLGGN